MPLRPCTMCRTPVPDGNCPTHPRPRNSKRRRNTGAYGRRYRTDRADTLDAAGHQCAYCGEPAATADHIQPHSRGGGRGRDNLLAACRHCNTSKGDRTVAEWIASGTAPPGAQAVVERLAER